MACKSKVLGRAPEAVEALPRPIYHLPTRKPAVRMHHLDIHLHQGVR